jgi:hypothetical protein
MKCDDDGCIKVGEMGEASDNHGRDEKYVQTFVLKAGKENISVYGGTVL